MVVLFLIGGAVLGCLITRFIMLRNQDPIGTLKVDRSDPDDGPYLFLEIDSGKAPLIEERKRITLRVDISQK